MDGVKKIMLNIGKLKIVGEKNGVKMEGSKY